MLRFSSFLFSHTLLYLHNVPALQALIPFTGGILLGAFCPSIPLYGIVGAMSAACIALVVSLLFPSVRRLWTAYLARPAGWVILLSGGYLLTVGVGERLTPARPEPFYPTQLGIVPTQGAQQRGAPTASPASPSAYVPSDNSVAGGGGYRFKASIVSGQGLSADWMGRRVLVYTPAGTELPRPGRLYRLSGVSLRPLQAVRDAGYRRYLCAQGVSGVAYLQSAGALVATDESPGRMSLSLRLAAWAYRVQQRLASTLDRVPNLTADERSMIRAITLGDKHSVAGVQEQFRRVGLAHLLSVSGFHVGIIYLLLLFLAKPLGRWAPLLVLPGVWAFAFISGLSVPTQRAAVMITFYLSAHLLNRPAHPVNILSVCALFLLISNPFTLFDAGFGLSFAGVLSILWFMPLLDSLVPGLKQPLLRSLWGAMAVCLAAQPLVFPLVMHYFGSTALFLLWSNVPIGLLAGVSIPVYLAYMTLSALGAHSLILAGAVRRLAEWSSDLLAFADTYYSRQLTGQPEGWVWILYFLLLWAGTLFVYYRRTHRSAPATLSAH